MRTVQQPLFTPETEWVPPDHLPDLSSHAEIAIDLETRDPNLLTMGSGCLLYTSPSPRDIGESRMPSSA